MIYHYDDEKNKKYASPIKVPCIFQELFHSGFNTPLHQ